MILQLYGMFVISSSSSFHSLSYARSVAFSRQILHGMWSGAPLPICSVLFFPECHIVAAYVFFILLSLVSFSIFPSVTCVLEGVSYARCDQSSWSFSFLFLTGYSCPPWLYAILLHFSHTRSNWSSPFFSSTIFHNFPSISVLKCPHFSTTHSSAPDVALY